jgi:phage gp29-like protein
MIERAMTMATQRPNLGELAAPEDPRQPLKRAVGQSVSPYTTLLHTTDSILQTTGGIENLKIYRELLRDDQVASVWMQRRLALTSCETIVEPGADDALSQQAAEALNEELKALAWDDVTEKMLFSVFYGWGVAEVIWRPNGNRVSFDRIVVRDRARFRFDIDRNLYLWTNAGGWKLMPERKFWTITTGADNHDEPYGLGLAHSLYWPVFFKRNDVKFWLMFLEKFGMPTAVAKVPAGMINDPATVQKAVAMLQQIATDAGVVVPDNVVVELLEAARSGSADYGGMFDAMNQAISKIVVGQTMTTDNGGSLAQSQVHERVAMRIVEADSDLLSESFNNGPVKWWTEWNFPGATAPRVYRQTAPEEDLARRAERDTKIKGLGYSPTEAYILETYGEGWEKDSGGMDGLAMLAASMAGAGNRNASNEGNPGQDFSEGENVALAALRAARRTDQQAMFNAARLFAQEYQTITGQRVRQVLQAAEFSEDPETFTRRLDEILAEAPPPSALEKIKRAVFFGGLLGAMRSNRRQA